MYDCQCATWVSEMQQMTMFRRTSANRTKREPEAFRMRSIISGARLLSEEFIMDIAPPCEVTQTKWTRSDLRQFERVPEISDGLLHTVSERDLRFPVQQRV